MEARASEQVVAEFADCAFLMRKGEEVVDFCLTNSTCDYCHGAHKFNVQWNSVPAQFAGRYIWTILELDSGEHFVAGSAILWYDIVLIYPLFVALPVYYHARSEHYGASGLKPMNVLATAELFIFGCLVFVRGQETLR